ncbi:MAG: hypothetical protein M1816_002033 [Peltula sp. TS41687]|nr:MAG: hypothetical protein M1816_002033 [Peltula sp. TS41687]
MALERPDHDPLSDDDYLSRARRLLTEVPLIVRALIADGHNDFAFFIRAWFENQVNGDDFNPYQMSIGHTDFTKLKSGQLGGQFWSAFVPCPPNPDDFSDAAHFDTLRQTIQQIDLIHYLIDKYPTVLALARTAADVSTIFRSGRIASLIGVEGLHQIGNSAGVLRTYYRLGVRYVTLTHTSNNRYADSSTSSGPAHGGLSDEGQQMIREMNRIGMIIDLSHTSDATQRQAIEISNAPVLFSHSSCSGLSPHPRNVSDDVLEILKQNGGVIMISFIRAHIDPAGGKAASLSTVADHVMYAAERIGWSHIGIGSDFDGMLEGPDGLEDTSKYPFLVAELLRRGVSEDQLKGVLGQNVIRVLQQVEEVAQRADPNSDILLDQFSPIFTEEEKAALLDASQNKKPMVMPARFQIPRV